MNKIYRITEGVFYITNVCNLTCKNCMTYNDRIFKGHFNWADHEEDYKKWATMLTMSRITILGGEPFSNPDLINWVKNVKKLWPSCRDISVCTNGTYLNESLIKEIISYGVWLDICVHDPDSYDQTVQDLETMFADSNLKKITTENHDIGYHRFNVLEYYSGGRPVCKISKQWNFSTSSVKEIVNGVTVMHKSDPKIAHENCAAKYCHYFIEGKLYKCHLTGVATQLLSQFKVDNGSAELLKQYKGCSPDDPIEDIENFVSNIGQSIPQCSLCPENKESFPIWPLSPAKVKYE